MTASGFDATATRWRWRSRRWIPAVVVAALVAALLVAWTVPLRSVAEVALPGDGWWFDYASQLGNARRRDFEGSRTMQPWLHWIRAAGTYSSPYEGTVFGRPLGFALRDIGLPDVYLWHVSLARRTRPRGADEHGPRAGGELPRCMATYYPR
ncbi:hypothetical protein [Mycobacterium sp.]|uniref:hypothetical protein n=1 Tax=Mycobacterium sp. TaxID=1785 RepID=UPI002D65F8D7|nr:hypothetical protein [Mycobacterium sp.]HZA11634.1 hypothetical protein [Mycobacterium sp.]